MGERALKLPGVQAKAAYAARRFYAWWEGYAFDDVAERAALRTKMPMAGLPSGRPASDVVAESIWGAGRLEPGSPVWTMRYARMLGLPVKADVIVFGAGAGGPLSDLSRGTKWKANGLTNATGVSDGNLRSYDQAMERIQKASAEGALSFFQLSSDPNPVAFTEFAAELMLPGSKIVFLDYAVARKGARLPKCFPGAAAPKTETEYRDALRAGGFVMEEAGDDTLTFMPLIAQGWAGWRRAYDAMTHIEDLQLRADLLRAMSDHARLWAERYEALKSGQLRVLFMRAAKR